MKHLSIDIETRSSVDIGKAGLYKYAQSPDFRILLFAFQEDGNPVEVVDLARGGDPGTCRSGCLLIRMSRNMRITRRLSGTA